MEQMKSAAAAAESNAERLQWHPAFSSAFRIEPAEDREELHMCAPGIYRAAPDTPFPVQFIINTRLEPDKFKWLSRLRSNLTIESDVEVLAKEYKGKEKNPLYETVMDVIMRANKEVYEEAKDMCQALRELFAEELEERENKGESKLAMLISRLFADGRIDDARRAASDEKSRKRYYQEYGIAL